MFLCSHFSNFLSDPIGQQSAMSKRMAKPRPAIPAKARPLNFVARSPRSKEDFSQSLGYLVNPVNADERKEVEVAPGNSWRSASRSEVGYSQASRQENAPMASGNSWREEQLPKKNI